MTSIHTTTTASGRRARSPARRFSPASLALAVALGAPAPGLAQALVESAPRDLTGDGRLGGDDLAMVLASWGAAAGPAPADLDRNGLVDQADLLALLAALPGDAAPLAPAAAPQAFPLRVPSAPGAPAARPLGYEMSGAFRAGVNVHDLGAVPAARIAAADLEFAGQYGHVHPGPDRVGIVRDGPPLPLSIAGGAALEQPLGDGQSLWLLAIRSPGAHGMRVHFMDFDVGRSSMLVYAFDRSGIIVRGPYTGRGPEGDGDFWTPSLPGEIAHIEVRGRDCPHFELAEVAHFDRDFGFSFDGGSNGNMTFPCHLDVMCQGDPPVNPIVRDAVGEINMVGATGLVKRCTGTLLNDLDGETIVPYFITANHCINSAAEVTTMEVVWFWQKDACDGTLPNYNALPRTTGGVLLVNTDTDDSNDMAFIRLTGALPGGLGLAGWTTETPDDAVGIHHPGTNPNGPPNPNGSWKRATILSSVGFCPGCAGCEDPFDFDFFDMDKGLVEGGSSGSGVFNLAGQLAGQLLGRCDDLKDPATMDCSNIDEFWTMYGEFETTWEETDVQFWLTLGGTIHVNGAIPDAALQDGTPAFPFNTVAEASSLAWDGARIKISPGGYPEALTISKEVLLMVNGGTVTIGQ